MTMSASAGRVYEYMPDYAVAPGETLAEVIENLNMTQKELAVRSGLTEQTIVRIMKGHPITFDTANKLELVTGVPARFWNNLEMRYREQQSKVELRKQLERGIEWLQGIPTRELIARGAITEEKDKVVLLQETLRFYGVSSIDAWHEVWTAPEVAARRSNCFETRPGPASAWIRLGELQAQQIVCQPFDKQGFLSALQAVRSLTTESPDVFIPEMRRLCAAAGVALAFVREIKGAPWNGASKWLSPRKAMILLSLRGKGEDIFWFSFFHEAHHVLCGKKQRLYIADPRTDDPEEAKADQFAAEFLIPASHNPSIAAIARRKDVLDLAEQLGVCPGIVAGRYRHITKKWDRFKDLTRTFAWPEHECVDARGPSSCSAT